MRESMTGGKLRGRDNHMSLVAFCRAPELSNGSLTFALPARLRCKLGRMLSHTNLQSNFGVSEYTYVVFVHTFPREDARLDGLNHSTPRLASRLRLPPRIDLCGSAC